MCSLNRIFTSLRAVKIGCISTIKINKFILYCLRFALSLQQVYGLVTGKTIKCEEKGIMMKKLIDMFMGLLVLCLMNSCAQTLTTEGDVAYTEGHNYFVRNDVTEVPTMITTQEQFERYFGMAAVMGKNGMPTAIDFAKQYVIAAVMPLTDIQTEMSVHSLKQKGDTIVFTYRVKRGEQQSYTMRPMLMIVVDNKYKGVVKMVEEDF